jgi:alanyl-tRNA synthetase
VGAIEIIAEEGVSAGTRRIVALTGEKAKDHAEQTRRTLVTAAARLHVPLAAVPAAVRELAQKVRDLKKQLASGGKPSAGGAKPKPCADETLAEPSYSELKAALRDAARVLNITPFDLAHRVDSMLAEIAELEQQVAAMAQSGQVSAEVLIENSTCCGETRIVVAELPGANRNLMRQLIDQLRKKTSSIAVLFGTAIGDDRVLLIAGLSGDLVKRNLSAGDWIRQVAPLVGGGGGGKSDMAEAGGKEPEKLPEALAKAGDIIRHLLAQA